MTPQARAVLAARSPLACRFMAGVMRRQAARQFHAVRLARATAPRVQEASPLLVYANHPSWWDPALFVILHDRLFPRRAGFGPMAAAELRRYRILARIGVFPLPPGAAGARHFLAVADGLLARPETVLWITAQGAFRDPRARPPGLQPGVAHLMRRVPNLVALPLALEYPFWEERTPEALARFGPPLAADPQRSLPDWQAALEATLAGTMDSLAADAQARDSAAFETLVAGRAGIGGAYDLWRRARALLHGEAPRLHHGATP